MVTLLENSTNTIKVLETKTVSNEVVYNKDELRARKLDLKAQIDKINELLALFEI
jgi:hypothetical protein